MQCPQCESKKVKKNNIILHIFLFAVVIALIPIIGWVTAPVMMCVSIAGLIVKKVKGIETMKCIECKNPFQVPVQQYKEYKKASI